MRPCVSGLSRAEMYGCIFRQMSRSTEGSFMKPHIAIIGVGVRDFERAKGFYRDGLHWPILQEQGEWVCFGLGDGTSALTLYPWDQLAGGAGVPAEGSGFRGITFSYNVRSEERVADVLAEARDAGAKITKPAERTPWGGFSGSFADPEGNVLGSCHGRREAPVFRVAAYVAFGVSSGTLAQAMASRRFLSLSRRERRNPRARRNKGRKVALGDEASAPQSRPSRRRAAQRGTGISTELSRARAREASHARLPIPEPSIGVPRQSCRSRGRALAASRPGARRR
jgi:predicted enzyme related to lactoylglutathione lyase